jgi:hypothetical protein
MLNIQHVLSRRKLARNSMHGSRVTPGETALLYEICKPVGNYTTWKVKGTGRGEEQNRGSRTHAGPVMRAFVCKERMRGALNSRQ